MERIGVRELRQHASRWLSRVASEGESFEVTDRGRPVAMLVPLPHPIRRRLEATGDLRPARGDLLEIRPLAAKAGQVPLSEVLAEARRIER